MNIDEAAQYLGYRDAEHVEMQDLSEHSKWWELINKLTSKDETELNLHLVSKCIYVVQDKDIYVYSYHSTKELAEIECLNRNNEDNTIFYTVGELELDN